MTTNPARYQPRPDGGLDCLDDNGRVYDRIGPADRLALLYRCEPGSGRITAVEWHGAEADVVATWRKMWKPLAVGTLAGGPDINATLRLISYTVSSLDETAVALINATLSNALGPDTLESEIRRHAAEGIEHGHHDPQGSSPTG